MSVTSPPARQSGNWSPAKMREAWLGIDQNPVAQSWVTKLPGTIALHLAFLLVIAASGQLNNSLIGLIGITLLAIAVLPKFRVPIMVGSSLFYLVVRPFRVEGWNDLVSQQSAALPASLPSISLQIIGVGLFLAFSTGFLYWQSASLDKSVAKRPVLTLLCVWFALLIAAIALPQGTALSAILWSVTGVSISCFWYLAYAASDQKTKDPTPTVARAWFMRPFWSGSATPMGKSFGYLNKFDAKDETELASTRLKAMKLAVWALILIGVKNGLDVLVYQWAQVPELQNAVMAFATSTPFATSLNWASVISNYFMDLLIIAVWGHLIVATIRMVGYRIPRNTRNPMASRTLAEFWNRYFFYFKELLVDFFFYPAFLRYFKKNTKMRIAFATFCAAAIGNFLYHFTRETYVFATLPIGEALAVFQSAVFYSLVLATGLIISQWRGHKPSPDQGFFRYEILPRFNVFAFFCFLKIFDDISGEGSLLDRAAFTFSLFGI